MSGITKKDWTLLAISSAEGSYLSPVQLQKALFLLGQKLPDAVSSDFYNFRAYNYGPFDSSIYSDAESLAQAGLVSIKYQPGQRWVEYSITPEGLKTAAQLRTKAPAGAVEYLKEIVQWIKKVSFTQLLKTIYAEYPAYAVNSVFKG